jgi:hypothetical protein
LFKYSEILEVSVDVFNEFGIVLEVEWSSNFPSFYFFLMFFWNVRWQLKKNKRWAEYVFQTSSVIQYLFISMQS